MANNNNGNIDGVSIGTGFACPTIGSAIPEGCKLVRSAGKWRLVKINSDLRKGLDRH